MNRPVDYRTDFYSLGVTLYELFTGHLPFRTKDPLEMVHAHFAHTPSPPTEINPDLPLPISQIIQKLLAKNAEDRYQSWESLKNELRRCLVEYQTKGEIQPFTLATEDFTGQLKFPDKLYGRNRDISQLTDAFARIKQGKNEVLLVAGYSGVGKTSLVRALRPAVFAQQGIFIEGKFDQYQRSIPYSAWSQAFSMLVNSWLSEDETRIKELRAVILSAIGNNGQVLIDLIPNLEQLLGPQPPAPELVGTQAQNRLNFLWRQFFKVAATPEKPLVIFLDDVQWIDPASLSLIDTLVNDQDIGYLLMIGAYRDNEVNSMHPLQLTLDKYQNTNLAITYLNIGNLCAVDLNAMLVDSLSASVDQIQQMGHLLYSKTDGNVFFARQLLLTLADEGALTFSIPEQRWQWDNDQLPNLDISDNIVDHLIRRIDQLPEENLEMLKIAACLGNQFDLNHLQLVSAMDPEEIEKQLNLIHREQFFEKSGKMLRFNHDRIQQAAYALIPDAQKARYHLLIGQKLIEKMPSQVQDEYLFAIVDHLNKGVTLIERVDEQFELAKLNFKAANAAMESTAYAAALDHVQGAIGLLGNDGWQSSYPLMLQLHLMAAEAAYLDTDYDLSEQFIKMILISARSNLDRANAYTIRVRSYNSQNELQMAVNAGFDGFQKLGVTLQETVPADLTLERIRNLKNMTDSRALAVIGLLDAVVAPAYLLNPDTFAIIVQTALQITIDHGLTPSGCYALVAYCVGLAVDDISAANEFGLLAMQLAERPENNSYLCTVGAVLHSYVFPWQNHLQKMLEGLRQDIKIGLETGEHIFTAVALTNTSTLEALLCDQLDLAQERIKQDLDLLDKLGQHFVSNITQIAAQYVSNLRGRTENPRQFNGPYFEEAMDISPDVLLNTPLDLYYFFTFKSMLHFHLGDYQTSYNFATQAEPLISKLLSHYPVFLVPFYQSLALFKTSHQLAERDEKLDQNIARLHLWAEHAPMNFRHKLDLVLAEQARVAGDVGTAIFQYEQAIQGANQNGFLQDEALANELFGCFWLEQDNNKIAQLYLSEAHALYQKWGAAVIVVHLEEEFPHWLTAKTDVDQSFLSRDGQNGVQHVLDLYSIMKSAEAISSELEPDKLLHTLLEIAIENTGAQRAILVLERDGHWYIEAESDIGTAGVQIHRNTNISISDKVPVTIVNYTANTQEIVLLDNAVTDGQYSQDPFVQSHQVKSVLSMPLIKQNQLNGILYLENNLTSRVFTSERVEFLNLLSSQMALALDQARLYEQLEAEVITRTQALNLAEQKIDTLFRNSQIGISLTTIEGKVLVVNEALQQMIGYSENEIQQRYTIDFYADPTERDKLLEILEQSSSVKEFGVRLKRRDGTSFFANMNVSKIENEGQEVMLTMIEDITEQKRAEEILRYQASFLQSSLDALSAHIAILDENGVIVTVNEAWRRFADQNGLAWPDYGVGQNYLEVTEMAARDQIEGAREVANDLHELLIGQREEFYLEYPCHSPEEKRWFMLRATCFDSNEGLRVVISHEDVTERKIFEDRLEEAGASAERDRIARGLHDTVTQSLYSINLQSDATGMALSSGNIGKAEQRLEILKDIAQEAMNEMRLLIYQLQPSILREEGLAAALRKRLDAVEVRSGIAVDFLVAGDEQLPLQVENTLFPIAQEGLNNILKHAKAKNIEVRLSSKQDCCRLIIRDDGVGFDPEGIGPYGGYGLANMRDRLEKINGTLTIDSHPGKGTILNIEVSI